jgi:DNA-binding MarR family transcriptional regulator
MTKTDTANLGFLLCDTARLLRRRFDSRVRDLGLTRAQWQVLGTVSKLEGLKQAALAERLEIEPITLTRLLERMEKGGWIRRVADKSDRRTRQVFLTPKAAPVLKSLRSVGQQLLAEILDGIPPAAQKQLHATLLQLNNNLGGQPAETLEQPQRRRA